MSISDPTKREVQDVKSVLRSMLFYRLEDFADSGEINCTRLAETVADEMDLYLDRVAYAIPEWVFDAALDVADEFEEADG